MAHYWPNDRYTTTEAAPSNALIAGLERIIAIARQALASGKSDSQLLGVLSSIQSATLEAEHEHFGDDQLNDDDIPF